MCRSAGDAACSARSADWESKTSHQAPSDAQSEVVEGAETIEPVPGHLVAGVGQSADEKVRLVFLTGAGAEAGGRATDPTGPFVANT